MKALKRFMVVASVFCISVALFATGSSEKKQATTAAPAAGTQASGPEKFVIGVKEDIVVADWKTNVMTKYIEDALDVELEFVTFSSKDMGTKLNLMAMDGAKGMPDIIFYAAKDTEIAQWARMGVLTPLTRYYDDPALSSNIREAWGRIGTDYRGQVTSPDGEIYVIPSVNQSYGNEMPMKIWMYKPFLDKLGLSVPTTTDELYNVLKRVVNDDPNGNGIKDEIGITGVSIDTNYASAPSGWFIALMNSFVYAGGDQYLTLDDNGKVGAAYTTDGWKEGLRFMHKLMSEGLIQDAALTQNLNSFKAVLNADIPQVFMNVTYTGVGFLDGSSSRKDEYIGVMPFKGPAGVQFITFRPTVASARLLITKNCKNPEKAFMIGDLLSSELMSIVTRWGEQHVDWDYISDMENPEEYEGMYEIAGFDKYIVVYDDATFWASGNPQNKSYRQQGPYVRQYAIANGQAQKKGAFKDHEIALAKYQYDLRQGNYAPENTIAKLVYNSDENSEIAEIQLNLKSYVDEYSSSVLAGQRDLDKTWDGFLKELKAIGVDDYLRVTQGVYDRMYGGK